MNQRTAILTATAAIVALAWVDAFYLPMILAGPVIAGLAAGVRGVSPRLAAVPWLASGMAILILDFAVNGEDVAFHAAVAIFTAGVCAACTALGRRLRRPSAATA